MRRVLSALAAVAFLSVGILLLAPSAASAQGDDSACVSPDAIDTELATLFEAELAEYLDLEVDLASGDTIATDSDLQEQLGFPGKYDLAPGELIVIGVMEDIFGDPCPDGSSSFLTGDCLGMAMSFDDEDRLIDMVADLNKPGAPIDMLESEAGNIVQAFTKSNPFRVHVNGFVSYVGKLGEAGAGPLEHHWQIRTFGIELDAGGDPNPRGRNRNAGAVDLANDLPAAAKVNGLFKITAEIDSLNNLACEGGGYFETEGGIPLAEGVGILMLLGAGLGALFNARPAKTWIG